jgi:CrcB protein
MEGMARFLMICVGGFLGTGARYGLNGWVAHRFGESFPWGTLAVNVIGSFVVGSLWFVCGPDSPVIVSATTRQVLIAGVLGGFTTFSSFSLQTLNLLRDGQTGGAVANVVGSVALGLLAAVAGDATARAIWMPR